MYCLITTVNLMNLKIFTYYKKSYCLDIYMFNVFRDTLSNRYCGGSHTVMTPHQKVMRVEHFLTQWGPQTVQLTDGLIKGKDGKMYRSRLLPEKLDVCGPICWENQISDETRSSVSFKRKSHHKHFKYLFRS